MAGELTTSSYKKTGVNLKQTGSFVLCVTDDNGYMLHPEVVRMKATTASGVITPPTMSIGTNSPNYNNIMAASLLPAGLGNLDKILQLALSNPVDPIQPNTEVRGNITIGSVATGAHVASVWLRGELEK